MTGAAIGARPVPTTLFRNLGSLDMESAKSGHSTVSGRGRQAGKPAKAGQFAKSDPRSRAVNPSSRASDYSAFAADVLRDLNPRGPLEKLVVDHVVHSAWKLRANLDKQAAREGSEKSDPDAESTKVRVRSTELDRASRSMREALESLDYLRARVVRQAPVLDFEDEADTEIMPNEWPIVPCDEFDDFLEPPEVSDSDDEIPSWQGRLVFDLDVSDISPVVKGTWITVAHVVSQIVDGWTWADILRSHPELTEDDIRTCVAYAMSEENSQA
jgi:hypothetical protein